MRVPLAAVESRLLREVDDVLPGSDQLPGESDLPRLAYTEAVVNEALRLFPPAHLTSRVVPPGETLTVRVTNRTPGYQHVNVSL